MNCKVAWIAIALVAASGSLTMSQPIGSVEFSQDEGTQVGQYIGTGLHRVHFQLSASVAGDDVIEFVHWFRIHSADGATWTSLSAEVTTELGSAFDLDVSVDLSNADGLGEDTIGFAGLASTGNGLIAGATIDGLVLSFELDASNDGKTVCIDTVATPTMSSIWRSTGSEAVPNWQKHCTPILHGIWTYTVTNTSDQSNPGTLRYAMEQAELSGVGGEIVFTTSGTILLIDSLPLITTWIDIKGETSPSGIILDGQNLPSGTSALVTERVTQLWASAFLSGLEITNASYGIRSTSGILLVENCYVHSCGWGITVEQTQAIIRDNVISGNSIGIAVTGCCHDIENNLIGTTVDGLGFDLNTVGLNFGLGVQSGGTDVTDIDVVGNVICASSSAINLSDADRVYDNDFINNLIGLNEVADATCDGEYGIYWYAGLQRMPYDNYFEGNTISGHSKYGVYMLWNWPFPAAAWQGGPNVFTYNVIGTDPTGLISMANVQGGFLMKSDMEGVYGLPVELTHNVISGNGGDGVVIESMFGAVMAANLIGLNADSVPLPNAGNGIRMRDVASAEIGRSGSWDRPNYICSNDGFGIHIERCSSSVISANVIRDNDFGGLRLDCPTGPGYCNGNDVSDNAVYGNGHDIPVPGLGLDIDIAEDWGVNGGIAPPRVNVGYSETLGWCVSGSGPAGSTVKLYLARDWEFSGEIDGVHPQDSGGSVYSAPIATAVCDIVPDTDGRYQLVEQVCGIGINANQDDLSEYDVVTAMAVGAAGPSQFSKNAAARSAAFAGLSPISIKLIDPQGDSCGPDYNSIYGAEYDSLTDVNSDGDPDDRILLSSHFFGQYKVRVFPKPEAQPGDSFTLVSAFGDDTIWVAQNAQVPASGDSAVFQVDVICCELRGNVNDIGGINIADVTYLVAYAFKSGPASPCPEQGNVNGIGGIDIADVTFLVAFAFKGGPAPPPCQ